MGHGLVEAVQGRSDRWERATLRSSYELLTKFLRTSQRSLEKEIARVADNITAQTKQTEDREAGLDFYRAQVKRLRELRGKMEKANEMELRFLSDIQQRLQNAQTPKPQDTCGESPSVHDWYAVRLTSIIADYLLREGYSKSAQILLQRVELKGLIDVEIYRTLARVCSDLQAQSCKEALKWCGENRSRLHKVEVRPLSRPHNLCLPDFLKSKLELELRKQEFLVIVSRSKLEAIAYARQWFPPYTITHQKEIARVMGALAYPRLQGSPYESLLSEECWKLLEEHFLRESCKLNGLPSVAMLLIDLRAGLTALKTE